MPRRRIALVALLAIGLAALSACDNGSTASPAETVQTVAQGGLLQSYTATYALTEGGKDSGTVTVARTPSRLRLDVTTATGTATSITTPERTVACQEPKSGAKATCLVVAGPGKTAPPAFDPVLRKVFGDVLRVLGADGGTSGATVTETSETPTVPPNVTGVRCFKVDGKPKAPLAVGTYCFDGQGVPVALTFPSGTATITKLTMTPPAPATYVPAATPTPLPSTAS